MEKTANLGLFAVYKIVSEYAGRCKPIGRICGKYLKVPKREIFVTELFILSDPIWVGDLRTEPKKPFV
jgi:hypothetical protein